MPIRSNAYQRLVAIIHRDLGPEWTVTESHLLPDVRTGQLREVDVVIRGKVGGYAMTIGVEARDRGRVADVVWVESMAQKHADLPIDKLALWSPTGFSKNGAAKASALGIVTITTTSLEEAPWATIAQSLVGGRMKWVRPTFDSCVDVYAASGEAVRWPADKGTVIREKNGTAETTVGAILARIQNSIELRTAMLDHAPEGEADYYVTYEPPAECVVAGPEGSVGVLIRLLIGVKTASEIVPLNLRTIVHDDIATSLGELDVTGGRLEVVIRESRAGEPSLRVTHNRQGEA